ncbi:S-adenosylmethionine-dependent methyltransferase [Anaerocolumna cellulosilytica]|uniref:S-adenosylmethionine-dependent methyltransferase n=1 Tax=Anaerocolumna cellulosilytica TaxID=433286 RepID=A0A6S6R2M6_9FIRM|nr:methyltransferase domain-containing protein [Anaerocolumna cellulosilytica]MBB5194711.1 ubiquinone/menaquinone biosynthesis C-methylase UbiE [Anaerocolumna cellulosilytica]BCJ94327.1 S-adenosylmethionine-dependent methyltransferase [Anaerocolumna cellulosilytica]
MTYDNIVPWELLQKKQTWEQLSFVQNKKILDFGSGNGMSANHFAVNNEVTAIEPDHNAVNHRFTNTKYTQLVGAEELLITFPDETFDMILCHNVLEYVSDRETILSEFVRILKTGGQLSVLKHNKAGRVMQMVVLLNNFQHAKDLLDGGDGQAKKFGTINYYEDTDLIKWCKGFTIEKILGMRTFWDLQQNQEIQKDTAWQNEMLCIENKVSDMEAYKAIAFFHHVLLIKK